MKKSKNKAKVNDCLIITDTFLEESNKDLLEREMIKYKLKGFKRVLDNSVERIRLEINPPSIKLNDYEKRS